MKIIHFIDEIKMGGAQTHLLTIVKEMLIQHPNDVHKIVVLFEDDSLSDKFREIGVEVECLNLRKYFSTKSYFKIISILKKYIKNENPKIVETHLTWSRLLVNTAAKLVNVKKRIGYILSLEGADSIVSVEYLDIAYNYGLRALGPAHYGPGRYAQGTNATGGLGPNGKDLLVKMESLGIILDATHLCDDSFWEAMEYHQGPVWASHQNCRALVDHNRQFSDEQLKEIISRGAVIGMPMDAWMMVPGWVRGESTPLNKNVTLNTLIDHLVHVCDLAGNTNHVGLGTDLDGGFGREQCPADIETIADLQKLPELLLKRGFSDDDIVKFCHQNWLDFLEKTWS